MFETFYIKRDKDRIYQGDILKDFSLYSVEKISDELEIKEYPFPYVVVISQDCDLSNFFRNRHKQVFNQFLPNILVLPAFLADDLLVGEHIKNIFDITQEAINSKTKKEAIRNNNDPRYHFLRASGADIPDLIIDFKIYFSISMNDIIKGKENNYSLSLNYLARELLSQRFANYINRIGLPDYVNIAS